MSSIRIMRRAIVTFSLPTVGRPSYVWKLNPGLGFIEVWAPSTVLFGASILRAKPLLLEWKRSPSELLSIWYGKKGIEEFLKIHVLWWSLFFKDFRCYFTWYCTSMSKITLGLISGDWYGGYYGWAPLWKVVSLWFGAHVMCCICLLLLMLLLRFLCWSACYPPSLVSNLITNWFFEPVVSSDVLLSFFIFFALC